MNPTPQLRASRVAVGVIFFICGLVFAVWAARIPAIKAHLGLSTGELGLVLFGMPVGLVLAMQITGWGIARFGSHQVNKLASVGYCLVLPLLALAPNGWVLALALFAFGFSQAAMDISMNAQAVEVEKGYGRPIMSSFHAYFSLGGLVGGGLGSLSAGVGMAPLGFFALMAALSLAAVLLSFPFLLHIPGQPGGPAFNWPSGVLVGLGLILFCTGLGEGATMDWAAVYMREVLHTNEALAALAFAVFSVSMVVGRLLGDSLTSRMGPVVLARGGGVLAAIGLLVVASTSQVAVALGGFLLIGFGYCTLFPLVFSAAGRVPEVNPGVALASVATLGYCGFLLGPPLIGLVGEASSLRVSFVLVAGLAAVIVGMVGLLRPRA